MTYKVPKGLRKEWLKEKKEHPHLPNWAITMIAKDHLKKKKRNKKSKLVFEVAGWKYDI